MKRDEYEFGLRGKKRKGEKENRLKFPDKEPSKPD
jgi:hypothetical protein